MTCKCVILKLTDLIPQKSLKWGKAVLSGCIRKILPHFRNSHSAVSSAVLSMDILQFLLVIIWNRIMNYTIDLLYQGLTMT